MDVPFSLPTFLVQPFHFEQNANASQKLRKDLKTLVETKSFLELDDEGCFVKIGLISWIWEQFKGLLGFENHTKNEYLRFRLLQLVTQATQEGLLTKNDCSSPNSLIQKVAQKAGLLGHPTTRQLEEINVICQAIIHYVNNPNESKPDLNGLMQSYQLQHIRELAPQSILQRIKNSWQNQQVTQELTQEELDSFSQEDDVSEPSSPTPLTRPSTPLPKNPSSLELLNKLTDSQALAEELEKLTPSRDASYLDLYLRLMLINKIDSNNEKLIYEWLSHMLSPSTEESQKIEFFDRVLKLLDFQKAFALLVLAYRLPLLLIQEEKKQLDPSEDFIRQCQQMAAFSGVRLEKLIQDHPSEYQTLDLTRLSPMATAMQIDMSALTYQFLFELIEQQRLRQESEKIALWKKVAVLGSLIGVGSLFGGVVFAIKKLTAEPIKPPPTLMERMYDHKGIIVATTAILGAAAFALHKYRVTPKKPKIPRTKLPGKPIRSCNLLGIASILKSEPVKGPIGKVEIGTNPTLIDNILITNNKTLLIPKAGLSDPIKVTVLVYTFNNVDYLILNIVHNNEKYVCGFSFTNLEIQDDQKKAFIKNLQHSVKIDTSDAQYIKICLENKKPLKLGNEKPLKRSLSSEKIKRGHHRTGSEG